MPQVKICGITNLEDAEIAAKLGADYLGFVFFKESFRYISPDDAKKISYQLTGVKKVGVFVNESYDNVQEIAELVGLDVLQFHGDETPDYCGSFRHRDNRHVWKAIRVKDAGSIAQIPPYISTIDAILLDSYVDKTPGGTGTTFDWNTAAKVSNYKKFIKLTVLAGGLTPENGAEAIRIVRPDVVDISSGVQCDDDKRRKSPEKMKKFILVARYTR